MHKQNDTAHLTDEIVAAFVDEALTGDERVMAAAHLTGCEACAKLAKALYADRYALRHQRIFAPAGLADAVMARAASEKKRPRKRFAYGSAVAAALLFVLLGVSFDGGLKQDAALLTADRAGTNQKYSAEAADGLAFSAAEKGAGTFYDAPAKTMAGAPGLAVLPPEALFPEADGLLLLHADVWEQSPKEKEEPELALLSLPSEGGGVLVAYSISGEEYAALLPKGQLLRGRTEGPYEGLYILLVASESEE